MNRGQLVLRLVYFSVCPMVISGVADDLFVSWFMMFSTKSFQSRPTYGDFLLFKMAAADILDF